MNKIKLIIFVLFFANITSTFAQSYTISGYVTDANTNENLIGAVVSIAYGKIATVTNSYGFYSLTINKKDSVLINVSLIGYRKIYIPITIKSQILNFELTAQNKEIEEVIVTVNNKNVVNNNETGILSIPIKEIKVLPNLFGEVDVIKAFQLMPGVQSGGEAKSGLYVRGGGADQNLILLDEIPLYYVNHFGGMFSIFNADAVKNVKLIKGGFPARYGSRLSSILDVRLKDGNMQKFQVQGTIGVLSSKILIEGPIIKNKSSYIFSIRKRALPLFSLITKGCINYNFYDTNFKLNHKISDKNRLFLSFYTGNDIINFKSEIEEDAEKIKTEKKSKWGNTLGALRFNHIFNSKLFANLTVSYTKYNYLNGVTYNKETDTTSVYEKNEVSSGIQDINTKLEFEHFILSNLKFRYGLNSIYHIFTPSQTSFYRESNYLANIDTTFNKFKTQAFENSAFAETEFKYKFIGANLGIRASNYIVGNTNYTSFEPRVLINFIVSNKVSFKYSFAKMTQYIHLLNYSGVGLPSDFWMPSTENVVPETSYQHAVNASFLFYNNILEFSVEAYYKEMENLITFKAGNSFFNTTKNWEELIEKNGTGASSGIELLLQKKKGKLTGWVGATISKSQRQFQNLNSGIAYPYSYDSPFDVGIALQYSLTKNITASATWTYRTGYPVTLATERYFDGQKEVFIYDEINSYRMTDFHRLDVALNFKRQKKWGERTWSVSFINVYNRQNPYFYYYYRESFPLTSHTVNLPQESEPLKLYQRSFFPFLPSFSYSFSF